ncbi:MAG: response regulator [Candidatus Roizmanbacteria bacterium]|nr:response regulator [Candidatus Roizmanbacteria bacterium]
MNVLIVEDDVSLTSVYKSMFRDKMFNLRFAINGIDGLEKIEEETPDVVLLDILMPKMNGIAMLKKIRKDKILKDLPVIITTNLDSRNTEEEVRKLGISSFFVKASTSSHDIVDAVKKFAYGRLQEN